MKIYSEKTFAVDLISDAYPGSSPEEIARRIREELDIWITPGEVRDYLEYEEDFEVESNRVTLKNIFG